MLEKNYVEKVDEIKLEGRRMVDINYLFKSIQLISHAPFDCAFNNLVFSHEVRNGYKFILFYMQFMSSKRGNTFRSTKY